MQRILCSPFLGDSRCLATVSSSPFSLYTMTDHYAADKAPAIARTNAKTYSRAARRHLYTEQKWLPAEASLLMDFGSEIVGRRVLEIGAGSGRIASVLQERAAEYYATDVNPEMVEELRRVHPHIAANVADACDLSTIADSRFDTVIFSFNGLDSINFDDRRLALSEIFRVLTGSGAFIHSTHHVRFARSASHKPPLRRGVSAPSEFLRRTWNRFWLQKLEYYSNEYAVVNDRALHNGLLNLYVDPVLHFAHLEAAGFLIEAVYERSGRRLPSGSMPNDQWYYVVARKQVL